LETVATSTSWRNRSSFGTIERTEALLENFKAAMDLYFCFYNFVRFHRTIRCTPAMEAGVRKDALSIGDLVDMAA
jgi:hypothetical protein